MKKLTIEFQNCYGIQELKTEFNFDISKDTNKVFAIYAPNGLMKTSFTKSFQKIAEGHLPEDERYKRPSVCVVEVDSQVISKDIIHVLRSEIDISTDSAAITNILVDPANKAAYDKLLVDLDNLKDKLIKSLQKVSKVKVKEIEEKMLADWGEKVFPSCVAKISESPPVEDLGPYIYDTIFDSRVLDILEDEEFVGKANEFNERYQELFEQAGTIYHKGVFNPAKAETSFGALDKHGFFAGGHRVHMKGDVESINKDELDKKIQAIHAKIDSDLVLKKLRENLGKNAQTQAFNILIENLSLTEVEFLLEKLKPENRPQFRKDLWIYFIQSSTAAAYLETYSTNKVEIEKIEVNAAKAAPKWTEAVDLFNDRFVDMPFRLSVANQAKAALGKEKAELKFTFKDGSYTHECSRTDATKTLSQGEKRALYLLNFLFEVEDRKLNSKETLFIIDDIADSFDYKNKHAIIQYLEDLCNVDYFYQIILTHNYDFFRTLCNTFVSYKHCLMANRNNSSITLAKGFEAVGQFGVRFFSVFMLGDEIKVTSWRDGDAEDKQATLHLRNKTKAKPILLTTPSVNRLNEFGTRVSVCLRNGRSTLLSKIPEEGGANFFALQNYTKEMSLSQTIGALAPALDIDVWCKDGISPKSKVIEANDWKTITPLKLLQRLAPVYSEDNLFRCIENFHNIIDNGEIVGRAGLAGSSVGGLGFDLGVLVHKGIAMSRWSKSGILLSGNNEDLARSLARPICSEYALNLWAEALYADSKTKVHISLSNVFLSLGLPPDNLSVAEINDKYFTGIEFRQYLSQINLTEIILMLEYKLNLALAFITNNQTLGMSICIKVN